MISEIKFNRKVSLGSVISYDPNYGKDLIVVGHGIYSNKGFTHFVKHSEDFPKSQFESDISYFKTGDKYLGEISFDSMELNIELQQIMTL